MHQFYFITMQILNNSKYKKKIKLKKQSIYIISMSEIGINQYKKLFS